MSLLFRLPNCQFYDVTKLLSPNCHLFGVINLSLPNCHYQIDITKNPPINKFRTIVSEVSSFKGNPVCPTVSIYPLSRRLMVSERRSALEKAQAEGRVRDYDGQNEEKAAKIIQERYFSNKLNYSFVLIICKKKILLLSNVLIRTLDKTSESQMVPFKPV